MLEVVWNATGPQRWHNQLNFALVGEAYGGIHMLLGDLSSPQKQTILPTIVRKCSAECAIVITKLISFVARDLCLLSIVCGDGFRQLLNTTEPGYQLPSAFGGAASKARPMTMNIWTSHATQAYLTITAHFITAEWKMASAMLQTWEMPEQHTGVDISERLKAAASEWGGT